MEKEIIVNANVAEEIRIAILENRKLVDLDIETQSRAKHKGNIYKGIVSNIEDSLDAAFIEFGEGKQGFLPFSEIRKSLHPEGSKGNEKLKVSQVLSRGQELVIQVRKDEIGTKGAAVSTFISLPGRYVVLMHSDESTGGISRKIDNLSARRSAREFLARLDMPEGMAAIIRTAGMNAKKQDLISDFKLLCESWEKIEKGAQLGRAPTLLYREPDIVVRTIRDYFSPEVKKIVIDEEEEYNDALRFFQEHMPDLEKILVRHKKKEPIFHSYGIEALIEKLHDREVNLPSGGSIVIEQTEALVAIDVNSGRSTKEEDHESTVYKTNLEAVQEVSRQLRLRDLGGIIVIDLIDMVSRRHRRDVETRLKDIMQDDKARVKVGRISDNGTIEMTRQRLRQSHRLISHVSCTHCNGTGRVRDAEGLSIKALRKIGYYLSKKRAPLAKLNVKLPTIVAAHLNNHKRRELIGLSDIHHLEIFLQSDSKMPESEVEFTYEKRGEAGLNALENERPFQGKGDDRKHGKQRTYTKRQDLPTPSIGSAPSYIEIPEEETSAEWLIAEKNEPKHYDDALSDAFFGHAKEFDLEGFFPAEEPKPSTDRETTSPMATEDDSDEGEVQPIMPGLDESLRSSFEEQPDLPEASVSDSDSSIEVLEVERQPDVPLEAKKAPARPRRNTRAPRSANARNSTRGTSQARRPKPKPKSSHPNLREDLP